MQKYSLKKLIYSSVLSKILSSGFAFVALVLIARIGGPELRGEYVYYYTLSTTIALLMGFTLEHSVMHFIKNNNVSNDELSKIYSSIFIFVITLIITTIFILKSINYITTYSIAFYLSLVSILVFFQTSVITVFQKYNLLIYYNNLLIFTKLMFVVIILFQFENLTIFGLLNAYIFSSSIFMFFAFNKIKFRFKIFFNLSNYFKNIFLNSLKIHVSTIGTVLIGQAGIIISKEYLDFIQIGYYDASNQIIFIFITIVTSLVPVIYSITLNYKSRESLQKIQFLLFGTYSILLPILVVSYFGSSYLIEIIYGLEYYQSISIFKLQLFYLFFVVTTYIIGPLWVANGYLLQSSIVMILVGLLNLVVLLFLVNSYGIYALVISQILTSSILFVINILFYKFLRKKHDYIIS